MALKFRQFYKPDNRIKEKQISSSVEKLKPKPVPKEIGEKEVEIRESQERSFAIFAVGQEYYGIDLTWIVEVLHNFEIIPVPHLPHFFCGVTNIRGESIPVVVMAELLKQKQKTDGTRVCIIAKTGEIKTGLLVDSEVEIVDLEKGKMFPLPDCYTKEEAEFLDGVFLSNNRFVGILRIENAFKHLLKWRNEDENR
ncbi:MAG: chemotaxis protein CheW [candidate division WOR-3 bacterium]